MVLIDLRGALAGHDEQVPGVGADEMPQRLEDRAVRPGDGGPELLRVEGDARIDQPQRRPNMVTETVIKEGSAHPRTVACEHHGAQTGDYPSDGPALHPTA